MRYNAVAFLESLFRPPVSEALDPAPAPSPDLTPDDLPPEWRSLWEERVHIMVHDGGLHPEHAEAEALACMIDQMRREGFNGGSSLA
jgi:hypothetical protein